VGRSIRIALVGALAAALFCPPAQAAYPGANGKIAYTAGSEGLWTVNPDGTGLIRVHHAGGGYYALSFSPDGKRIAFDTDEFETIYTADPDGTDTTWHPGFVTHLCCGISWSPDGDRLAYGTEIVTECCGWEADIEIGYLTGSFAGFIDQANDPSWSPDGTRIAYARAPDPIGYRGCCAELWTADPNGTNPLPLGPTQAADPDWSPNGQKIAFRRRDPDGVNRIYVINRDGSGQTQISNPPSGFQDFSPAWSPDGTKIAFGRSSQTSRSLWLMNPDGTGQTNILPNPPGGPGGISWQPLPVTPVRPRGASPTEVYLVPAYKQCAAPNRTHGAPLAFGSCAPPQLASDHLTLGTPDVNGQGAQGIASVFYAVRPGNETTTADEADVRVLIGIRDVRNKNLTDYTGQLQIVADLRLTDRDNTPHPGGPGPGTAQDAQLPVTVNCTATTSTTLGSDCNLTTTVDAVFPGAVKEGQRAVWQLGAVKAYDGGSDGLVSTTAGNTLFMTQGLFVP
jgi:WD40-like Beta Propeller Repeat